MWSVLFDRSEFQFKYQIHRKWTGKNVQMFDIKKVYTYRQKCCCKCMRQWTESIYIKKICIYMDRTVVNEWEEEEKKTTHTTYNCILFTEYIWASSYFFLSLCAPYFIYLNFGFSTVFFSVQWQIFDAHYLLEYLMGLSMVNVKQ